jgi:hypothetical protein
MIRWTPVVATLVLALLGAGPLNAQQPAFKRTVVQKQDLSVPGREVVQAVAEIPAGMASVKAGESFFVPPGTVHDGKNEGGSTAKVLATYVVEKGKPLASAAQ